MKQSQIRVDPVIGAAPGDGGALLAHVRAWLIAQREQAPEARAGVVLLFQDGALVPTAMWPDAQAIGPLVDLAARAGLGETGLIKEFSGAGTGRSALNGIAFPIRRKDALLAVVALAVEVSSEDALQTTTRKLQWGAAGLELLLTLGAVAHAEERLKSLEDNLDLLASLLSEDRFDAAATSLVTRLATMLDADRVSLGLLENRQIKIRHLSHTSQVDKATNLVRLIEGAMEEAVDQRLPILIPATDDANAPICLAHQRLAAADPGAILTLPLYRDGEPVGALTLERTGTRPFSAFTARSLESLSALAIGVIEEKRRHDGPWSTRLARELRQAVSALIEPGRVDLKVALGGAATLALGLALAWGTDNLSASARLDPREQITLTAPFDGYVRKAGARAGDIVRKGQVLAALDDSDLELERAKWLSQLTRFGGLFQDATAQNDRVQTNVNSAERDEAQSQLDLTDALIARSTLKAPFDGLVVSGDLSQKLGAAVSKGDILFTVAPANGYRVDLLIKESRIAGVKPGQEGVLHLSALPTHAFRFTVRKITPKTVAENGASYFVVEGELSPGQPLDHLQPGMEGVGKVAVGRGWLPGLWTRELADWARLRFWGVFG